MLNPEPSSVAASQYRERTVALQATEKVLQREHVRLGYVRLAFGVAVLLLLFPPIPPVLVPLLAFAIAARAHAGTLRRLAAARRALAYLAHAEARLNGSWAQFPDPQPLVGPEGTLFAEDLDLFGSGSLFTLLCETRTAGGRDELASWLVKPASVAEVQARQRSVAELRPLLSLRETFAAAPGPPLAVWDRAKLTAWAQSSPAPLPSMLQWIAPFLVVATLLAAWRFAVVHSPLLLVPMLAIDAALTYRYRQPFLALFGEAEDAGRALQTAAALAAALERSNFYEPWLQQRAAALLAGAMPASRALDRLWDLTQWTEARKNYLVRLLDAPLLYSLQLGLILQRWRGTFGPALTAWLEAVTSMEAVLSLSAYGFEHPDDPFPQMIEGSLAQFQAEGLAHPLLPAEISVRNDVALSRTEPILLISGSNMSGKSTLLRSVGINAVLAFAGAPVRARSLALSPLTLAASIHVNDSLQAGRSRFYAEILRLRAIAEAAQQRAPVLFLIDELLAGTNSSDRLAGAQGLMRALLRQHAIGLLSTHDLALTEIAGEEVDAVRNMHFQDEVADGQLRFDYLLREGPVTRSNGVALMRLIGLEV